MLISLHLPKLSKLFCAIVDKTCLALLPQCVKNILVEFCLSLDRNVASYSTSTIWWCSDMIFFKSNNIFPNWAQSFSPKLSTTWLFSCTNFLYRPIWNFHQSTHNHWTTASSSPTNPDISCGYIMSFERVFYPAWISFRHYAWMACSYQITLTSVPDLYTNFLPQGAR